MVNLSFYKIETIEEIKIFINEILKSNELKMLILKILEKEK